MCVFAVMAAVRAPAAEAAEREAPEVPPPPRIMWNKRPIPNLLLTDKREGAYLTGLPLIGATPESGVVYGGAIQWYDNGPKDSPFFSYAPYRKKLSATITLATKYSGPQLR